MPPASTTHWSATRTSRRHPDTGILGRELATVAERLANDNPQSAMEWAASLPETAQGNAYAETMDRWTRSDAAEWPW